MPNHGLPFTPRGRGGRALDGTGGVRSRYLPFSDHTLSNVQSFQDPSLYPLFFSDSCALFCTHANSTICVQAIPYSLRKRGRLRSNKHSLFTRSSGVVYSVGCCGPW